MAARKFSATWRSGAVKILLVAEIRHDLNPWRKFAMAEKIAVAENFSVFGNMGRFVFMFYETSRTVTIFHIIFFYN